MNKKVVLAGGTGFIGSYFHHQFQNQGYEVKVISRKPNHISWSDRKAIIEALDGAELLINLAGKSVNCRYNEKNRNEIMNSRTSTTTILGESILACSEPPELWLNSSTATIYRHAEDRPMTEEQGEIGTGFSVDVAKAWEESFFSFQLPKTRQAALRIAIVLGKDGGVMTPYQNLVRFGLGGVQGSGRQKFSWIHVKDLFRIIMFLKERKDLSGVFNCSAPQPVSNSELMNCLRRIMKMPVGLPAPKWMLEIGSIVIRTETELVLKSRWVLPERLQREGFRFTYNKIDDCLTHILKK
ncbi:TIGR01777 family oxidoreductase [Bacillus pinisoli]|uniref:TIGR01777 family oxidoreductase n=1 Tax=Bacillus pinisoli TaxID=2901866 RepID=UPI001FF35750|nr:TIGR01777 family oxidoreductase [Bacillus pinisoli]